MSKFPLIALCPIGKFVFSHAEAVRNKKRMQATLKAWDIRVVDLDEVLPDGLVRSHDDVEATVAHFRKAGVDGLFLMHGNFGTESAVGMIAAKLNVPTLLWGPRDAAPEADGTRLTDTLCGLLAASKVLHKMRVQFSYLENCWMDDPALKTGIERFVRSVDVARALRSGIRIAHIGQRIDFFWSTIVNESELLQRFNLEIQPVDLVQFIADVETRKKADADRYADELAEIKTAWTLSAGDTDATVTNILAVRDQMLASAADYGADAIAIQDFMSLVEAMGTYCFAANSMVSDILPVACESDIHGAISNVLLQRATGTNAPVFLTDIATRHPDNDNAALMWHVGAPLSMIHPTEKPRLDDHWILPTPYAGMPHFRLQDGPLTVARFDGDGGSYQLAFGEGHSVDGPWTQNNYLWMEVDDWPRWERRLMQGPFIHHVAMAYGHHASVLQDACRFIDGLESVALDGDR